LYPRLGSITGGSFLAAVGVYFASSFFLLPGLILLARWALLIPVIVIEGTGAFRAFGRSNELVRQHTGRVVVELIVSTITVLLIWWVAYGLWAVPSLWISAPVALAFLALATPPIPLMRTLSYYDRVDAAAKQARPVADPSARA
jgi:hypothetical protein